MMGNRFSVSTVVTVLAAFSIGAVVAVGVTGSASQAPDPSARPAQTPDGRPNFNGVWQALNEAHWDLEAHEALPGMVMQEGVYPYEYARVPAAPVVALGAAAGVPGSMGVVQGDGRIPYTPEALAIKEENGANWIDRDPELKCYLPGTPRAMYMPYPFQIVQGADEITIAYEFSSATRIIHLRDHAEPAIDSWMGWSNGRWEGDTLVVDVTGFNGQTWFDRAGNFHSNALHVVERYTPVTPYHLDYEVTIEDPSVFERPWTMRMPLYRRMDAGAQVMDFRCLEFVEPLLLGSLSNPVP